MDALTDETAMGLVNLLYSENSKDVILGLAIVRDHYEDNVTVQGIIRGAQHNATKHCPGSYCTHIRTWCPWKVIKHIFADYIFANIGLDKALNTLRSL